jgi:Phage portal protein, SPP1 Gp6-like
MPAPTLLRLSVADDDEQRLIEAGLSRLFVVNAANREAQEFYDGSRVVRDLGISTPPSMMNLKVVAGWPGTVVDVLEERLDWLGWCCCSGEDDFGLADVYAANDLDVESGMAHLDALIFGLSFVVVGTGDDGEPNPLITPSSPLTTTGIWDARARRLSSALSVTMRMDEIGQIATLYGADPTVTMNIGEVTLYQPDYTVTFSNSGGGAWQVIERDDHRLGRVPVVMMPNRARGSRQIGRSEITRSVRYYTDAAARTLRGLEANREFYTVPKLVALNVAEEMFQNPDGQQVSQWSAVQGRLWTLPPTDDPELPQPDVKQFTGAAPTPYVEQIRGYAVLLAAEAGLPTHYLGFPTENPASADAIRAGEARLVKRAERRQVSFGRAWREVGRLALLMRDGAIPDAFDATMMPRWRNAATPTVASTADAGQKQLGAVPWLSDTDVGLELLGLDDDQISRAMSQRPAEIANSASAPMTSPMTPPMLMPNPATASPAAQ